MDDDLTALEITVNGKRRSATVDRRELLIEALRNRFGVTGPKIGCLTGDCGACTVRLDGLITKSCLRIAVAEDGAEIETLESMSTNGLTGLQESFWDNNAFQCGYCLSGMLFAAEDLLDHNPTPDEDEIRQAISGNLCRCTGYDAIVTAIKRYAERVAESDRRQ
ncbi:carbon-monoxide dehydrogenase small subunit [Saccharothrix tamanrassetensis]|uniref:Carbon-monoxide dehydrogenase small subunit n=1 Tax=Saccharothrix tamanrassetensis TaxID=1051531 RepID=A0A841CFF3_9PSEU|nr:(2Fe-2S)-binding protein [Saccharothrix tamanrassetensis]MBB5957272.1 carbon-monoxide dehydrogenase small subunit [Saccharothrix tamanrassetensis]